MNITKSKQVKFLFISYSDLYGGGSIAGYRLHKALLNNGYISMMVVNRKLSNDDSVIELNGFMQKLAKDCISGIINFPFSYIFGIWLRKYLIYFYKLLKISGSEIFFYPESRKILKKINYYPDIIHFHIIHGDYFDISLLTKWSKETKLFFTLHDLWLFTGHCAVPLDCDRYKIGCGSCPDLSLPPSIPKDRTKENYYYKSNILKNIPINFIAPSHWVYNQIQNVEINIKSKIEIITNAVDTNYFKSGNKNKIRSELKLPIDSTILLTCSVGFKYNPYKDIETLLIAFNKIEEEYNFNDKNILLVILGEKGSNYDIQNKDNIIFTDQIFNTQKLLTYFQLADLYIHSSHIETWGLSISEALSVGMPVIASDVGGISEQVKGYKYNSEDIINKFSIKEANGILFERGNIDSLYHSMKWAINNKDAIHSLAINARAFAVDKLNIDDQLQNYLHYCSEILPE